MKYRKKPVEIYAIQFTRHNWEEIGEFTGERASGFTIERRPNGRCYCFVMGELGRVIVNEGDFIVMESSGFFKVVPSETFNEIYEVAE